MSSYEDVSSFAKLIECICPMCEKKHKRLIHWTGNGIPRKRCLDCENTVIRSDDVEVDVKEMTVKEISKATGLTTRYCWMILKKFNLPWRGRSKNENFN